MIPAVRTKNSRKPVINDKDFILYECSHNNGFASTNAQVRKTDKVNNQHYVCGGVNALFSNCNSGDKEYMPKFKGLLDKAGLVHLEIEPDDLNIGIETSDRNIILSSMKIGPDYKFALIRNQMRPDIEMFNNSALVVGPHRTFPSEEEIKFDALSVAAITQAMNETFTDDFLHCEESYDDPRNDLSDYCV